MTEKCMCEYCKIQRGEGMFQVMARRRRIERILTHALYMILGFGLGFTFAEVIKGLL